MGIVYVDGDTPLAEAMAKESSEWLVSAYPNHSWWVECRGGVLIVKHFMLSGLRGAIGMIRHVSALDHDAKVRKQSILTAAGELLERGNLARGAYTGEQITSMELEDGIDKHWHRPPDTKVIH